MRTFLTFLAAYVLSQFYRSFLAVIAPELARELGLDPQALGNLQAWWILGFVAMQVPVGFALDRFGPRHTVAGLMLAAVAGAALLARGQSALALDIAMVLIGVGCSAIYMGAIYVFGRVNRPEHFALLCSWLLGIGSAGNLLAASPLAWASVNIGWRGTMLAIAGATLLSAFSVLVLIVDPPRTAPQTRDGFVSGVLSILKIRSLWPLLPLTGIGYAVVLSERGLWAGPFFTDVYGLAPVARGNALLAMAAAMSAGAIIYGPLDRWLGTRKWIVVAGSAAAAGCFLILGSAPLSLPAATVMLAAAGAFGMTYGVLMAHARSLFPEHLLGRGITLMNVLFIGGAGVLQPISGAFMKAMHGAAPELAYGRLHLAFGLALAAALVIYLFADDRAPEG